MKSASIHLDLSVAETIRLTLCQTSYVSIFSDIVLWISSLYNNSTFNTRIAQLNICRVLYAIYRGDATKKKGRGWRR